MATGKRLPAKMDLSKAHSPKDSEALSSYDATLFRTASSDTLHLRRVSSAASVSSGGPSHQSNSAINTGTTSASSLTTYSPSSNGPKYQMSLAERIWADERQIKAMAAIRHLEMMEDQRLRPSDEMPTAPHPSSSIGSQQPAKIEPNTSEDNKAVLAQTDHVASSSGKIMLLGVDLGEPLSAHDWFGAGPIHGAGSKESSQTTPTISINSVDQSEEVIKEENMLSEKEAHLYSTNEPSEKHSWAPDMAEALAPEVISRLDKEEPGAGNDGLSNKTLTQPFTAELPDNTRVRSESSPTPDSREEVALPALHLARDQGPSTSQRSPTWAQRRSSISGLSSDRPAPSSELHAQDSSKSHVREEPKADRIHQLNNSHSSPSLTTDATSHSPLQLPSLFQPPHLVSTTSSLKPDPQVLNKEHEPTVSNALEKPSDAVLPPLPPVLSPPDGAHELSSSPSVARRPVPASFDHVPRKPRSHSSISAYNTLPHEPFPILAPQNQQSEVTEDAWISAFRDIYTRHNSTPERMQLPEVRDTKTVEQDTLIGPEIDPRTGKKWIQHKAMTWVNRVPEVEHVTGIIKKGG